MGKVQLVLWFMDIHQPETRCPKMKLNQILQHKMLSKREERCSAKSLLSKLMKKRRFLDLRLMMLTMSMLLHREKPLTKTRECKDSNPSELLEKSLNKVYS